jgi:tetratricopeptide (TPR) repeat protein
MNRTFLLLWGMLLALGLANLSGRAAPSSAQDPMAEPTVFRKLSMGGDFPDLELLSLEDKGLVFDPEGGQLSLIAMLRPDQESSRQCLSYLESLVLDKTSPDCQVTVVGMKGRRGPSWIELGKALPRKIALYRDAGTVQETLGMIVHPSIALLDRKGQLYRSYVLFDAEIGKRIRADLETLTKGTSELDPTDLAKRRFAHLEQSAFAMEAAGEWQSALSIRRRLLELEVHQAQARLGLGRILYRMGKFQESAMHLRKSIALEPTVSGKVLLGRTLARMGELQEARALLLEILPLAPRPARIHRELADIFKKEGDLEQTLEHLKAAIDALQNVPIRESDEQD